MDTNITTSTTFKIQIPSLLDNIHIVESFIDNAKEKHQINEDMYGNIMIAVTESVNNAITHGNQQDKNKKVNLIMELQNHKICFKIEDEGNGFDFKHLQDPTAPENISMEGGRGVFLMKNLADEVNFYNEGRGVELVFYIS